jgi:aldehyde dehydrogenase (NAD+)
MQEISHVYIDGRFVEPHGTGFKQSGIGREYGVFGLKAYLEPKAILDPCRT